MGTTPGIKGLHKTQAGKETVLGTEVNATFLWLGPAFYVPEDEIIKPTWDTGHIMGVGGHYTPFQTGVVNLEETELTFEQVPYLLNMGVRGVAGVQDGAGSDYTYTYAWPDTTVYTPYTYSFEVGDNQQERLMTACFAEEITISGQIDESLKMEASLRGWPQGETTFTSSLTPPAVEVALFNKTKIYIDDVGGTIGTTQFTNSFLNFELSITNIYKAQSVGDGLITWDFVKMSSEPEITLTYQLEHDSQSSAEIANRDSNTPRMVRIDCTGSAVGTAGTAYSNKHLIIDVIGTYTKPEEHGEEDGNMVVDFEIMPHYNSTADDVGSIVVVNELSALT